MTEVRPLSKAPNPQLKLAAQLCPSVCVHLDELNACRAHISLLVILCIIVYVTNKKNQFKSTIQHLKIFKFEFQ